MPKNETHTTPHAALVAALCSLSNVAGTKVNPQFRTRYVTLDALLDSVRPILAKHDLALSQPLVPSPEAESVGVETNVIHASGHVFAFGVIRFKAAGLTPQQISSAVTYGRRIGLSSALGISTDLDDDGASASRGPARQKDKAAGAWFDFLTAEQLPKALAYCVEKRWIGEAGALADLPSDKVELVLGNKASFVNAITRPRV